MSSAAEFASRYRDRVAEWAESHDACEVVLLGDDNPGRCPALTGWWRAVTCDTATVVLPNPWDDRSGVETMERYCWAATEGLLPRIAASLDQLHGTGAGERYWHMLIAPWLLLLVTSLADRCLFLETVAWLKPNGVVIGRAPSEPPATMEEALQRLRCPSGNAELMSLIAGKLGLRVQYADETDALPGNGVRRVPRRELLKDIVSNPSAGVALLVDHGVSKALRYHSGGSRRRLAVVGHTGLSAFDELRLFRRVPGLGFPGASRALTDIAPGDTSARRQLPTADATDGALERAVLCALPHVLPRSLFEGYDQLVRASRRGYGLSAGVLIGNYSVDDVQNEFIARCAARGFPLAFAQHGGSYGQARVHAQERLEMAPCSEFWSWGRLRDASAHRVASPWLSRLSDTHRGGEHVVLVEGVHPPDRYVVRFASTPLANQTVTEAERLERLVLSSRRTRPMMRLKRYPERAEAPRPQALAALAHHAPRGVRGASGWMQRAAIAVVAYPDTPFIEALVIGVPTIGLWDLSLYEWREDAREVLAQLIDVGVVFEDPVEAARHLDAISGDPCAWWGSESTQAARRAFLDRFATTGGWLAEWTAGLARLASKPPRPAVRQPYPPDQRGT